MNCDDARETVSAAADGEASAGERAALEAHLGGCAACRAFLRRVELVDRSARVRPAEPVPDLVGRVTGGAGAVRPGRGSWMRPALAWVAVVLAGQNVPALVLGATAGADSHLARHLGAFGVALAIGFAYVAWRPHRAIGLLPLVAALVATMVASTAFDLLGGDRSPLAETVHLPELAGLALLWMIAGSPGWRGRAGRVEAGSAPTT